MKTVIYQSLPDCARQIREEVFIKEQGFEKELDATDSEAAHIVLFDESGQALATCRVFPNPEFESYNLGRLAVLREYRGKKIGSATVRAAEQYVRETGGVRITLHSQCRAVDFYRKLGFTEFGDIEDDEGCPHIWMKKELSAV
ncbi:MAG: GNAT family N-acetyltransferase [bacterium]|nr:GNAT family N-acetyltransferase [bacterium]